MVSPNSDPIIAIWDAVSEPHPDGDRTIRWAGRQDLVYLYETGFVDTDKFPLEEWIESFRDSLQKDGPYLVSKEQWLAKRRFRYEGPTRAPLDPLKIREGEWSSEEFEKLVEDSIVPATSISREKIWEMAQKNPKLFDGEKYKIGPHFRADLKQLLDLYPSPRRRRELMVAEARKKLASGRAPAFTPSQGGAATGFTTARPAGQVAAEELAKILGKK